MRSKDLETGNTVGSLGPRDNLSTQRGLSSWEYKGSYWNSRSRHLQGNRWMQMLLPYAVLLLFTAVPLLTGINALWFLSAVPITASIIQIIRQHPDFRADGYRYLPVCLPCGILLGILFLTNHILYWS